MISSYNQLTTPRQVMLSLTMVLLLLPFLMNIEAEQIIQAVQTTPMTTQVSKQTTTKSMKADGAPTSLAITKKFVENVTTNDHQINIDDRKYTKANSDLDNFAVSLNDTFEIEDSNGMIDEVEATNQKTFNFSVNNYIVVKAVIGQTNYSSNRLIKMKQLFIEYKENITISMYKEEASNKGEEKNIESSSSAKANKNEFYNSDFERWNSQRLMDGLLCQNDSECNWLDRKLICKTDVQLNFNANVRINLLLKRTIDFKRYLQHSFIMIHALILSGEMVQ